MAGTSYLPRYYRTTKVQYAKYAVIVKRLVVWHGRSIPPIGEDEVVIQRHREDYPEGDMPDVAVRHFIGLPGVVRVMVTDRDGNASEIQLPEEG